MKKHKIFPVFKQREEDDEEGEKIILSLPPL